MGKNNKNKTNQVAGAVVAPPPIPVPSADVVPPKVAENAAVPACDEMIETLAAAGARLIKATGYDGKLETVQLILTRKGINVDFTDEYGYTPLMNACLWGHLKMAETLIAAGANVHHHSKYGDTPFSRAASRGNRQVMDYLLTKGVVAGGTDEAEALCSAAYGGHVEIIKFLLDSGDDINRPRRYGATPLIQAAGEGKFAAVKLLIERGAVVNTKNGSGDSALMLAAKKGSFETVKLLIEKGATVVDKNSSGETVTMYAAKSNSVELMKLLVSHGGSIHDKNNNGETVLMRASNKALIQHLVEQGADVKAKSKENETALHMAAIMGYLDIVQYLVERGVDINLPKGGWFTALYWASVIGNPSCVTYLIAQGTDLTHKDFKGETALEVAKNSATRDAFIAAVALREGPPPSEAPGLDIVQKASTTNTGGGPAASSTKAAVITIPGPDSIPEQAEPDISKLSIGPGFNDSVPAGAVKAPTGADASPSRTIDPIALLTDRLYEAAGGGDVEQVKHLLSTPGLRIDQRIQNSETALIQACYVGHVEVVRLLVEVGGADLNLQDQDGWTALHWAAYNKHVPVVAYLLSKGADTTVLSKKGSTAAQSTFDEDVLSAFAAHSGSHRGDSSAANLPIPPATMPPTPPAVSPYLGLTETELNNLLGDVCAKGDVEKVKLLLITPGVHIDCMSENLETPLIQACYEGHLPVAQLLVEKGANLNLTDSDGWTALHWAAYNCNAELVKLLLHKGADATILSKKGSTAQQSTKVAEIKALFTAEGGIA